MDYYKLKILNNKRKIIVISVSLLLIMSLLYYFFIYQSNDQSEIIDNFEIENKDVIVNSINEIFVDIKGQVKVPGVYSFNYENNARIKDLIDKAGGLTKDADTSTINLSKKLEDEMTIIIYSKKEIENFVKTQDELKKKLELCELKIKNNACIQEKRESSGGSKVNINEATKEELITIPGIGESKAKAILEYRSKNKFNSIEDIKNVEGIGESLFASIKENITI